MKTEKPPQEKFLLVCENIRETGKCCGPAGSKLREQLKAMVKKLGLGHRIRVSRAGCLDLCAKGPSVLLEPDGIWFQEVRECDLETLLAAAMKTCHKRENIWEPETPAHPA